MSTRIDCTRSLVAVVTLASAACLSSPTGATTSDGGDAAERTPPTTSSSTSASTTDGGHAVDGTSPSVDATTTPMDAVVDAAPLLIDGPVPLVDAYIHGDGGASRCTISPTMVMCSQEQYTITTPAGSDTQAGTTYPSYDRVVHYQIPLGTAPAAGWPAVFMFQGSFLSAGLTFDATSDEAYGMYYQTELVKALLDAGYAVLAPEVLESGETYWQTNIPPYAADWSGAPDDLVVQAMLADVANGTFGPLDPNSLFATGISSGGYMTSRMAVSYVGKFKALAIESGAYATCLSGDSEITGGMCTVPALSATHPPTLFLHGDLDTVIIPEWTVQLYESALKTAGVTYKEVDDANSGHQWIPEAPSAVLAWFETYK